MTLTDPVEDTFHLLLSDNATGGAAAATERLFLGLKAMEVPSEWWHFSPLQQGSASEVHSLDPRRKRPPFERILKNFNRALADSMRRDRHRFALRQALSRARPKIINCHNIHSSGLNHDDLTRLPGDIPLVWTMHDRWPFATRAFEWDNRLKGSPESICQDLPEAQAVERRRQFFAARPDVVLVAPSRWLGEQARQAVGGVLRIEHIPYGVSSDTFKPRSVTEARERLGLDPGKIWLGSAATHAYSRKGLDVLALALQQIDCTRLGLLSWGQKPDLEFPAELECRFEGSVNAEEKIAWLYAACDIFVCPSRADNLPNVVLESLSCGIPVIGSNAGGIPDMVRPGATGWIFESDDPSDCAAALSRALREQDGWPSIRRSCRAVATTEYTLELQASRYLSLFDELIAKAPAIQTGNP